MAVPPLVLLVALPTFMVLGRDPHGGLVAIFTAAMVAIPCAYVAAYLMSGKPKSLSGLIGCVVVGTVLCVLEVLAVVVLGILLFGIATGGARLPVD
jgi:hypothetical protein